MTNAQGAWTLDELAEAVAIDIGAEASRLALRLSRLLAHGRPVTPDQVQRVLDELGIDQPQADKLLKAYTERDHDETSSASTAPGSPSNRPHTGSPPTPHSCGRGARETPSFSQQC